MIKRLSKKAFVLLMLTLGVVAIAEDIKLVDESNKSTLVQKEIAGCEENGEIKKQQKDLEEIKKQLAYILQKLSALENEKNTEQKSKDISNIKNCLSKLTKEKKEKENQKSIYKKDYTVVIVEQGDRLSDYAKKYYGDKRKYYKIYKANRDKIAEDLQLIVGDKIIIPLSPNYKYKKFKKIKHIPKKNKPIHKQVKHHNSVKDYPMAKIFTTPHKSEVDMLEEPVFVDDKPIDNSGFLPLDDN